MTRVLTSLCLMLSAWLAACSGPDPSGDPCDGLICQGGTCVYDEGGVRCRCQGDSCPVPDDPFSCQPCADGDSDNDVDVDVDVDGDADNDVDVDVDGDVDSDGDGDADVEDDADADEEQPDDADIDEGEDADIDIDIVEDGPVITGIDGTGAELPVVPGLLDEHCPGDECLGAPHRVSTTAQDLIISGENLAETTSVRLAVATGGDPIELTIDPARRSMDQLRVIFPGDVPRSLVGALLTLTLIAPAGTAEAQVFFLQGESPYECDDEGHCTLTGHLTVDGALDVTGDVNVGGDAIITGDLEAASGTFDLLTAEELMVSVWEPECPRGYQRDETREDIVLCERGRDQMVKVGDFWVDRYEATVSDRTSCDGGWYGRLRDDYPATFLDSGQVSNTVAGEEHRLFACSVSGGTPSRLLTWFQAQVACAASGKHLIANAEWQAAVEGTVDPGSSSADVGHCLTNGGNPRPTGSAGVVPVGVGSCISLWGAEDMIGNLNEWTSDWWQAGLPWVAADGQSTHPWSGILNDDITVNINGRTTDTGDRYVDGLPAAVIRGGDWGGMLGAGAFNTIADVSPVFGSASIGFRCARSY